MFGTGATLCTGIVPALSNPGGTFTRGKGSEEVPFQHTREARHRGNTGKVLSYLRGTLKTERSHDSQRAPNARRSPRVHWHPSTWVTSSTGSGCWVITGEIGGGGEEDTEIRISLEFWRVGDVGELVEEVPEEGQHHKTTHTHHLYTRKIITTCFGFIQHL